MGICQSSLNQKSEKYEDSYTKTLDKKLKNKEKGNNISSKVEIIEDSGTKTLDKKLENKEEGNNISSKFGIFEDSDTFILEKNLEYREAGNYISSIKEIIAMTIEKEKKEAPKKKILKNIICVQKILIKKYIISGIAQCYMDYIIAMEDMNQYLYHLMIFG